MSFDLNNDVLANEYVSTPAERNRVLRDTYALLGLSMIPTVIGAAAGVFFNLGLLMRASPFVSLIVFMAGAYGLMYMVEKNRDNAKGVAWLMAFTLFMGVMLSMTLSRVLGFKNGTQLIMLAFGGTAVVFVGMAAIAARVKSDLSGMHKFLMIGFWVLLAAMIANIFLAIPALHLTILAAIVLLFSAFLMYDLNKIMTGGETNYISATLSVYLSIYNIFSALLQLLGIGGGSKD
jgi:modulator of FtsH protease